MTERQVLVPPQRIPRNVDVATRRVPWPRPEGLQIRHFRHMATKIFLPLAEYPARIQCGVPPAPSGRDALQLAIIGKAVALLSGPGGLASFLRRRQLGGRLGGPSLPLDVEDCGLFCWFHHHIAIHLWGWTVVLNPDGTTTAYSPDKTKILHSHGPPPAPPG